MRRIRAQIVLVGTAALVLLGAAGPEPPALFPGKDLDRFLEDPYPGSPIRDLDLGAMEHGAAPQAQWPPADPSPPYDVQKYELTLQALIQPGTLSGTARITLLWGSDPDQVLDLDMVGIVASAVRDGGGGALGFTQDASQIHITLPVAPTPGDSVTVEIDYAGTFGSGGPGFYVRANASFTFTEPQDSRYWFPCYDEPWDKAQVEIHGKAPPGMTWVSNGELLGTTVEADGTVWHWKEDHPVATYLIAFAVGDYQKVTASCAATSLSWYAYPSHVALSHSAYTSLDEMLEFYDASLVPYPFDKYTIVEGSFGGGMEHQSCTLQGEFMFTDGNRSYEWITAHEAAHHWFGDLVTTEDWRHIWLNEGFATFYDAVWHEDYYGETGTRSFAERMQSNETSVIGFQNSVDHPVVDPPINYTFSTIIYRKGAWVLSMLRDAIGKAVFDQAVTDYLTAHAYGNADTDDFIAAVEAAAGQDLSWFWTPWLYGTGRADLQYDWVSSAVPGGWLVQIDVRQVQTSPTIFRIPLEVRVQTAGGDVDTTLWVESAREVLSVQVPAEPTGVLLDPRNRILGTVQNPVLAAGSGRARPATVAAWPNPFRSHLVLAAPESEGEASWEARIFDARGRLVRAVRGQGEAIWDGRDAVGRPVRPGVYFVRRGGSPDALRVVRLGR